MEEKEVTELLSESFVEYFDHVVKPYVTSMCLTSQKGVLTLVQEAVKNSENKDKIVETLDIMIKCIDTQLNKISEDWK